MSASPKIAILLSTYNGGKFLEEQLDSLLGQSYKHTVILVRDDGSDDDTLEILWRYKEAQGENIHVLAGERKNLGASASFAYLLRYVLENKASLGLSTAYCMFADQDDIWAPDKIARQVDVLLQAEKESPDIPLLVHSDLEVVAEDATSIATSLAQYQGLEVDRNTFPNLLISNLVTGCTALFNEALITKALPIPANAIMHDWWLALVGSAFGRVLYIPSPLVRYRQHGSNTIGAKEFEGRRPASLSFWRQVLAPAVNEHLFEVATQARAFRQQFAHELKPRARMALLFCSTMGVGNGFMQRLLYRIARRF